MGVAGRLSGTVSPFRAEQGTSLETPSRARASSCQAVVMPSSHLILCRPLLLLPPISPSIGVLSNEYQLHHSRLFLSLRFRKATLLKPGSKLHTLGCRLQFRDDQVNGPQGGIHRGCQKSSSSALWGSYQNSCLLFLWTSWCEVMRFGSFVATT